MRFAKHSSIEGRHATLSPSNHSWIRYDPEKMEKVFLAAKAAVRGTELHEFAKEAIRLGITLPDTGQTLNSYVNDAIGFRMSPEQVLFYSDNAFGTTDAMSFRQENGVWTLRIHDLKTGLVPADVEQLEVYAAFFCLEYDYKPFEIRIELRIYQNDEIQVYEGDPDKITHIMEHTKLLDRLISKWRMEDQ